jgi:hypothetical protein
MEQDEESDAAVTAKELNDHLGGKAKQFWESQGAESAEFLALFPAGLRYEEGSEKHGFANGGVKEVP